MKKELTITDVEKRIDELEWALAHPMPMAAWSKCISIYHALHIKLANMKGEHVSAEYSKSDYII